ncbi:MAG: phosphomannomutase/phosphoglucomutase, partial [Candidatus Hydrothermae bacterium]|nr:phosphomannomutase/phosphoglucomutase [Candidatus Hydrothermae bacterium]
MKWPNTVFRMYDIRGIAGTEITPEFAHALGRAFAGYAGEQGVRLTAVGGDVRTTTPELKEALMDGLLAEGMNVLDLGTVPTPVVYFS